MGKILGARVLGIAGSQGKCDFLEKELGVDKAVNYKSPTFKEDLTALGEIDVFFDNVGGEILDFVLTRMREFGRIVVCGEPRCGYGIACYGLIFPVHRRGVEAQYDSYLIVRTRARTYVNFQMVWSLQASTTI